MFNTRIILVSFSILEILVGLKDIIRSNLYITTHSRRYRYSVATILIEIDHVMGLISLTIQ